MEGMCLGGLFKAFAKGGRYEEVWGPDRVVGLRHIRCWTSLGIAGVTARYLSDQSIATGLSRRKGRKEPNAGV